MIGRSRMRAACERGLRGAHAPLVQRVRELDDEDRVLRGEPDGGEQPDLEVDVVREPAEERRRHRADDAERHDQHHRDRDGPALVQRREAEEDDEQRDGVQRRRVLAGEPLLEREPGPVEPDARPGAASRAPPSPPSPRRSSGPAPARPGWRPTPVPLKRSSLGDPEIQRPVAKAENGTISPLAVAHEPALGVLRQHAERRVGLHVHALGAPLVDEVVHVGDAPGGREQRVHVGERDPERGGLLRVHVELVLRGVLEPARAAPSRGAGPSGPSRGAGCAPP